MTAPSPNILNVVSYKDSDGTCVKPSDPPLGRVNVAASEKSTCEVHSRPWPQWLVAKKSITSAGAGLRTLYHRRCQRPPASFCSTHPLHGAGTAAQIRMREMVRSRAKLSPAHPVRSVDDVATSHCCRCQDLVIRSHLANPAFLGQRVVPPQADTQSSNILLSVFSSFRAHALH